METQPLAPCSANDVPELSEIHSEDRSLNDTQMIALALACKEARQRIGESTPKAYPGNSDASYLLNALSR